MIVLKAPNFQRPRKLSSGLPVTAPGDVLPVAPPAGWHRQFLAGTGGVLGEAAADSGNIQEMTEAGGDLFCDTIEFLTRETAEGSPAGLKFANAFVAGSKVQNFTCPAALDITTPLGKELLRGLGQVVDSLDENPVNVTVGICIALTQTVAKYWDKEIGPGIASLDFAAAGLAAAGLVAEAHGYKGVSSGLATVGLIVRAGKNTRLIF